MGKCTVKHTCTIEVEGVFSCNDFVYVINEITRHVLTSISFTYISLTISENQYATNEIYAIDNIFGYDLISNTAVYIEM